MEDATYHALSTLAEEDGGISVQVPGRSLVLPGYDWRLRKQSKERLHRLLHPRKDLKLSLALEPQILDLPSKFTGQISVCTVKPAGLEYEICHALRMAKEVESLYVYVCHQAGDKEARIECPEVPRTLEKPEAPFAAAVAMLGRLAVMVTDLSHSPHKSRATSLAVTKLEEAEMWLRRYLHELESARSA